MNTDEIFRKLRWVSVALFIAGAILIMIGLSLPGMQPPLVLIAGVFALIGALILWAIILTDRCIRSLRGKPPRNRSFFASRTYTCPTCGYALRGVEGICCPECGTIRPARVDGEDDPND